MRLTPPRLLTVIISFLLAFAALAGALGAPVPVVGEQPFLTLLAAYVLLLLGTIIPGL